MSGRSMADIESDIRGIRARMDSTLNEIEFRLSPGQLTGHVGDVARDVIEGRPTRVATAIRNNPIPVALIGIGALWLAWAVSRTDPLEGATAPHGQISDQRIRILLAGLVAACRQGAEGFREADMLLVDAQLSSRLAEVSNQFERTSASLDHEFRIHGGVPEPGEPVHPAWLDLHDELTGARSRAEILSALQGGLENTLDLFRDALQEALPDELRVVVGAHFHDLERVQHRIGALREAVS
ncbi:hypothetical protein TSO221_14925 [Azospirillum sp. TSO22-1]|nr:hypothetical protein TSO221_14925 [Azospirillum sp. TSO22-1]